MTSSNGKSGFTTIQPAIDEAFAAGGAEVWVAEGTYGEGRVSISQGRNTGSLVMREGVSLYGGFRGTEQDRASRDWRQFASTIDGSTAREGQPSYHVIIGANVTELDGLVIQGGRAGTSGVERSGAGYFEGSSFVIRNCMFTDNVASAGVGGGLSAGGTAAVLQNCVFSHNSARVGGGASTSALVENCLFIENETSGSGAGLSTSQGRVSGCLFMNNHASVRSYAVGGAVRASGANVLIEHCAFVGNSADVGAAIATFGPTATALYRTTITNCLFYGNTAAEKGAALYMVGNEGYEFGQTLEVLVTNCSFANNSAPNGVVYNTAAAGQGVTAAWFTIRNTAMWDPGTTEIVTPYWGYGRAVMYSNIRGGVAGEGNLDADPLFVDAANGDLRLQAGSPCIDAGTLEEAPDVDIAGVHRPIGAGVDIGAYEYYSADVNGDGPVDAVDIQLVINAALGLDISPYDADINTDGAANSVDVQLTINAALGM